MTPPLAAADRLPAYARLAPLVLVLTVGTLLGVTTNLVKLAAAAGWPPVAFLFWAAAGSGLILLLLAAATGNAPRLGRRELGYYLGSGLLSAALPNALSFAAVPHVGAGFVAFCLAFPPLLTYGLALALGLDRFRAFRAAGVLLGLAGAFVLALAKALSGGPLLWLAVALAAPLVIAGGNIFRTLCWPPGAHPLALAPGMLIAAALMLGGFCSAAGIPLLPNVEAAGLGLVALQVAVFAATYSLYFLLQRLAGPVVLSQIGSVAAAAGAAIAVGLLGEAAAPALGLAMALILAGAAMVSRRG